MNDNPKPQARRGVPGEPYIEIRTREYPAPRVYAFYGVMEDGTEFGITYPTFEALENAVLTMQNGLSWCRIMRDKKQQLESFMNDRSL